MEGINLVNYKVKGIKSIDKDVSLSFYKKIIDKNIDFKNYNIKGIYGLNGSGKTAIISSVKLLKDIFFYPNYFSNELNQKKLHELINKKYKNLVIVVDFLVHFDDMKKPLLYRYEIEIGLSKFNNYIIKCEKLGFKIATSKKDEFNSLIEIEQGNIKYINISDKKYKDFVVEYTRNLLLESTLCSVFYTKLFFVDGTVQYDFENDFYMGCFSLLCLGLSLCVYLDDKDLHHSFMINELLSNVNHKNYISSIFREYLDSSTNINTFYDFSIKHFSTSVKADKFDEYCKEVIKLEKFIQIFKTDLKKIEIDKRIDGDIFNCRLILKYNDCDVDSEFESNGIKKLIDLFQFFQRMVNGDLVFIDELDSNLHDVYLCALLDYLSFYGKGQLCFTSHNIGPMDVLRKKKKSIDFLSVNSTIHSWTTSGNYSPSKLYRNGMIEGSPFNVDRIDFIGVFEDGGDND